MSHSTTTHATFTAAELAGLDHLASTLHRPVTVEVCTQDGPAWAALVPVERRTGSRGPRGTLPTADRRQSIGDTHEGPALSVQVTDEPGRRLVLLAADGREVLAAGDHLADLVQAITH